jgi:hypothetical protein
VAQTLANLSCETWVPHRGVCLASGSSGGWHAGLTFKRLVERSTMSFQLRVEDEHTLSSLAAPWQVPTRRKLATYGVPGMRRKG